MNAPTFLNNLAARGVTVTVADGKLRLRPASLVTEAEWTWLSTNAREVRLRIEGAELLNRLADAQPAPDVWDSVAALAAVHAADDRAAEAGVSLHPRIQQIARTVADALVARSPRAVQGGAGRVRCDGERTDANKRSSEVTSKDQPPAYLSTVLGLASAAKPGTVTPVFVEHEPECKRPDGGPCTCTPTASTGWVLWYRPKGKGAKWRPVAAAPTEKAARDMMPVSGKGNGGD